MNKTLAQKHARAQWLADRDPRTGGTGRYHGLRIRIERCGSCWNEHRLTLQHEDGRPYESGQMCASVEALKRVTKGRIDDGLRRGWIACPCQPTGNP